MKQTNNGNIIIDENRWPLVLLTFKNSPAEDEFEVFLEEMTRFIQRKEKQIYLIDALQAKMLDKKLRIKQAQWMKLHQKEILLYSLGSAVVLKSSILRFILTTIFLIQPPLAPLAVVPTLAEGRAWITERLWIAGLRLPTGSSSDSNPIV